MVEMAANDVKDIDEPKTYREMFQKIMRDINDLTIFMIEFKQGKEKQDKRIECVEDTQKKHGTVIAVAKWIAGLVFTGIIAFFVLLATGQLQVIRP